MSRRNTQAFVSLEYAWRRRRVHAIKWDAHVHRSVSCRPKSGVYLGGPQRAASRPGGLPRCRFSPFPTEDSPSLSDVHLPNCSSHSRQTPGQSQTKHHSDYPIATTFSLPSGPFPQSRTRRYTGYTYIDSTVLATRAASYSLIIVCESRRHLIVPTVLTLSILAGCA